MARSLNLFAVNTARWVSQSGLVALAAQIPVLCLQVSNFYLSLNLPWDWRPKYLTACSTPPFGCRIRLVNTPHTERRPALLKLPFFPAAQVPHLKSSQPFFLSQLPSNPSTNLFGPTFRIFPEFDLLLSHSRLRLWSTALISLTWT